jgi:hypothetical protein
LWWLLLPQKDGGLFHCKEARRRPKACPPNSKLATATWGEVLLWIYLDVKYPDLHFFYLIARVQFTLHLAPVILSVPAQRNFLRFALMSCKVIFGARSAVRK